MPFFMHKAKQACDPTISHACPKSISIPNDMLNILQQQLYLMSFYNAVHLSSTRYVIIITCIFIVPIISHKIHSIISRITPVNTIP